MILNNWVTAALASMSFYTMTSFMIAYLAKKGLNPLVINLYFFTISIGFFILFAFGFKQNLSVPKETIPVFLLLGFVCAMANVLGTHAVALSPNPGYVGAIATTKVIFITLLSVAFLEGEFSPLKLLGISLIICGAIIVIR